MCARTSRAGRELSKHPLRRVQHHSWRSGLQRRPSMPRRARGAFVSRSTIGAGSCRRKGLRALHSTACGVVHVPARVRARATAASNAAHAFIKYAMSARREQRWLSDSFYHPEPSECSRLPTPRGWMSRSFSLRGAIRKSVRVETVLTLRAEDVVAAEVLSNGGQGSLCCRPWPAAAMIVDLCTAVRDRPS
jgi:hypothetical protein